MMKKKIQKACMSIMDACFEQLYNNNNDKDPGFIILLLEVENVVWSAHELSA